MKIITTHKIYALCIICLFSAFSHSTRAQMAMKDSTESMKMISNNMEDTMSHTYIAPLKPEDISPLLIGEKLPEFSLPDIKGNATDINMLVKEKPTVLVVYRGGWCPYCSLQLSGLQEIKSDLYQMGYQMIAISTDAPEQLSKTMQKQKLDYQLFSDADLSFSKALGLAYRAPKGYDPILQKSTDGKDVDFLLPVPSIFIVGKDNRIQFEYINPDFKQRMNATLLKSVAQSLVNKM